MYSAASFSHPLFLLFYYLTICNYKFQFKVLGLIYTNNNKAQTSLQIKHLHNYKINKIQITSIKSMWEMVLFAETESLK